MGSSVIFIDGGNTFDPYVLSSLARQYSVDPKAVLGKIFISRAFTAYQLAALIFERLRDALQRYKPKLVVISDVAGLFFDRDVPKGEAKDFFNRLTVYLADLALKEQIIILVSYLRHGYSKRSVFMESALMGRANVVIRLKETRGVLKFLLEKHPRISPLSVEFPLREVALKSFREV